MGEYICTMCHKEYEDRDGGAIRGNVPGCPSPTYPTRCFEMIDGHRCGGSIVLLKLKKVMNENIFKFDKNIPPELLPRIKELLMPLIPLIPKWCEVVEVRYSAYPEANGQNETTNCTTDIQYEYRKGNIDFYPSFFAETPEMQSGICIHEFVHLTNGVLADYARKELERLLPKDEASQHRATVLDELNNRVESVTQDTCWIIRNLSKNNVQN